MIVQLSRSAEWNQTEELGILFDRALEPRFRCADIVVNGIPNGCREN